MIYLIIDSWTCPQFRRAFLANPRLDEDVADLTRDMDRQSRRTVESIVDFVRCFVMEVPEPERHSLLAMEPDLCPFILPEDWLYVSNYNKHTKLQREQFFPDLQPSDEFVLKTELILLLHGLAFVPGGKESIKDKVVLDVGAFKGDSALCFSRLCQPKHIYSFEPIPYVHDTLVEIITKYNVPATPIRMALGASPKTVQLKGSDKGWGQIDPQGEIEIQVVRMDDFVAERGITDVGLIKVDTEGYEREVLQGSVETIRRDRPILLMSIYHNAEQFLNMRKWVEEIRPDYRYMVRRTNPQAIIDETYLICY